jgi:hypothetical protein
MTGETNTLLLEIVLSGKSNTSQADFTRPCKPTRRSVLPHFLEECPLSRNL